MAFLSGYVPLSGDIVDGECDAGDEPHDIEAPRLISPATTSNTWGWRFFTMACFISLVLSASNLTYLSATQSYHDLFLPTITPSVYTGLDNVKFNLTLCRSRVTFPKVFATVRENAASIVDLVKINAFKDAASLDFGDEISAHVDFYIPDHGLENCTFVVKFNEVDTPGNKPSIIETWMLQNPGQLSGKVFLGNLNFASGTDSESTTNVFYCPSGSHIYFQLRCPRKGCRIHLSLEGVTSLTAVPDSLSRSSFRLSQYEALSCIPNSTLSTPEDIKSDT